MAAGRRLNPSSAAAAPAASGGLPMLRALPETFQYTRHALELVWSTSRGLTVALALLTLLSGILPAAIAWVGAQIVDAVVAALPSRGGAGAADLGPVLRRRVPVTTISSRVRSVGGALGAGGSSARALAKSSQAREADFDAATRQPHVNLGGVGTKGVSRLGLSRVVCIAASPSTSSSSRMQSRGGRFSRRGSVAGPTDTGTRVGTRPREAFRSLGTFLPWEGARLPAGNAKIGSEPDNGSQVWL